MTCEITPEHDSEPDKEPSQLPDGTYKIVIHSLIIFGYFHLAGLYGLYLCFTEAKWATIILCYCLQVTALTVITAGPHRLWSHRSYKAKLPLQILLVIMSSMACQYTAINWCRDHRMHHKYSETDADPHNARRGFMFSHIGWLVVEKHPDVKEKGKTIDCSDLYANPVLMFQKRYGLLIIGTLAFLVPTLIAVYFWGECLNVAWHVNVLRIAIVHNITFCINSFAHIWGNRPYDKNIQGTQNTPFSLLTMGEGFHNYHHVFPWDYKAAEFGNNCMNFTTMFIDFFAWIGWAYDLKSAPGRMVRARAERTGDGSDMWGWGRPMSVGK